MAITGQPLRSANATSAAGSGTTAFTGQGIAHRAQPGSHHRLVLGVDERLRAGPDGDPGRLQGVQDVRRYVLVIERDHVTLRRESGDRRRIGVVADDHVVHDLSRRDVRPFGEQSQP